MFTHLGWHDDCLYCGFRMGCEMRTRVFSVCEGVSHLNTGQGVTNKRVLSIANMAILGCRSRKLGKFDERFSGTAWTSAVTTWKWSWPGSHMMSSRVWATLWATFWARLHDVREGVKTYIKRVCPGVPLILEPFYMCAPSCPPAHTSDPSP